MPEIEYIAGVVVRDHVGSYLLVQEARPDIHGLWALPAGHIDPGETAAQAAVREAREETGYQCRLLDQEPFWVTDDGRSDHLFHVFLAEMIGGELNAPTDEIMACAWLTFDEVLILAQQGKFRSNWSVNAIKKVESGENSRH